MEDLGEDRDILVVNAGTSWGAPYGEWNKNAWDKVLDLNVTSVFLVVQAYIPPPASIPYLPSSIDNVVIDEILAGIALPHCSPHVRQSRTLAG